MYSHVLQKIIYMIRILIIKYTSFTGKKRVAMYIKDLYVSSEVLNTETDVLTEIH